MATNRAAVLAALEALVKGAAPSADFTRNGTRPEKVGKDGAIVFRDGDPGEPEQLLGDPAGAFLWSHVAELELAVTRAKDSDRTAALEALVQAIDAAIAGDPGLGGRCDMVTPTLALAHEGEPGSETLAVALIRVTLEYQTRSPLGF